jgi:hypothetical protein
LCARGVAVHAVERKAKRRTKRKQELLSKSSCFVEHSVGKREIHFL